MTTLVWVYLAYLVVCLTVTVWVGRTLQRNAPVFLHDGEKEGREFVHALIHLLTVGFYLINIGAVALALKYGGSVVTATDAIELLSTKVGVILLVLGLVHSIILAKLVGARKNLDFERVMARPRPVAGPDHAETLK